MSETRCTHCNLPVPAGLIVPGAERQFCCGGCRTVYEVIHDHGLEQFYRVARSTGETPWKANPTGRSYEDFDDPAFLDLYARPAGDGLRQIELYLENVHCAACVWLVERVSLALPGVVEARLDVRRSQATVIWNPAQARLSVAARFMDQLGYTPHPYRGVKVRELRREEDRRLLLRIGVAGAVAANVMLIAVALYGGFFEGMERQYESFFRWVSLLAMLPAMFFSASVFFKGAWAALKSRRLHMDLPVSIGLLAGFASGVVNTVRNSGDIYFDSLATLILLLLGGRWLERRRQRESADAAELLYSLSPAGARRVDPTPEGECIREVPVEALKVGDLVEVRAGDLLPVDGIVVAGRSELNLSLLTGESRPEPVEPGQPVHAGTTNLLSPLRVRVEATGEETRVGRLLQVVEEAAGRRAPIVRLADRIAGWFVGAVVLAAGGTFALWLWLDPSQAVNHTVALLIVSCPCALGLATPLAVSVAVGRAARAGILVKGGDVIEALSKPGLLLLDKTGTLTEGRVSVVRLLGDAGLLGPAAALERRVQHPVARALVDAQSRQTPDPRRLEEEPFEVEELRQDLGGGIRGRVDGHDYWVGSPAWVGAQLPDGLPGDVQAWVEELVAEGHSPVVLARDGRPAAVAGLGDALRPDAARTVARLQERGWRLGILSGDHPRIVARVAAELGLPPADCRGGVLPEEKLAAVEAAARQGVVVMVGDGVNDAAALSAATVGVSVHGGAEASLAAADVFLTTPGLGAVADLVDGARRTVVVIRRNLLFSLCYNLLGAGLAIAGYINPLVAALLMPLSSLTVVTSSFRAKTFR
ncbi:MAG: heavy metal translocating P-type ATPase [Candidatus Delongbacteria bacterium]